MKHVKEKPGTMSGLPIYAGSIAWIGRNAKIAEVLEVLPFNPQPKKRKTAIINCSGCRKELERRADQVNKDGKNYCRPCNSKRAAERMKGNKYNPQTKEKLNCKECKQEFLVFKSKLEVRKFCSEKCSRKWQTENQDKSKFHENKRSGKTHPQYKHGKKVGIYKGKEATRKIVKERDGDWCHMCGKPGPGMHLHRVIFGSHGGKYEPGNCVLLCAEDHVKVHGGNKREFETIFLDYLKTKAE